MFCALRMGIVGVLCVPLVRPPRGVWRNVAALSAVLGVGHFGLLYIGIKGLDVPSVAIALQLGVPFSSLLARVVRGERLGRVGLAGMGLALAGVALIAGEPHRPDLARLLLVIAAAFAWAVNNLLAKRVSTISSLALNGWVSLLAAPQLVVLSLLFEPGGLRMAAQAGASAWLCLTYTVLVSSILAYTLWYRLVERLPINRIVPLTMLNPVIGIIAGALLLAEPLGWIKILGAGLTLSGVAILSLRPRRVAPAVEAAS